MFSSTEINKIRTAATILTTHALNGATMTVPQPMCGFSFFTYTSCVLPRGRLEQHCSTATKQQL
jgi:hypothetical protein